MKGIARQPVLDEEEEWDPQGLSALDKAELESFDESDEEEEEEIEEVVIDEEDEDEESEDLNVDGLTELEQMERSLRDEESLDFAMLLTEEE